MTRLIDLGPDPTEDGSPPAPDAPRRFASRETAQAVYANRVGGAAPLFTVFTDASLCPRTGICGWAVWAKSDGQTLRVSGLLRSRIQHSGQAELMAMANGVAAVVQRWKPIAPGSIVLVQTDSLEAIRILDHGQACGPGHATAKNMIRAIERKHRFRLRLRHVKGHRGVADARAAVNTWVDAAAKQEMRAARDREQYGRTLQPVAPPEWTST